MKAALSYGLFVCLCIGGAQAQETTAPSEGSPGATPAATQARTLGASLIYSVDRSPESPFETPRAVEVITSEDIWRSNATSLADLLVDVPGFHMISQNFAGGAPVIRGLLGKQVLIMIDGVRLNNSTWRTVAKEYLNIIDLSQVDRIEIVRGVVSVLGTESLGGVVNIITRKGPGNGERLGGTISAQYESASAGFRVPLQVYGQGDGYRFSAGATAHRVGDLNGGGDIPTNALSDYSNGGFHAGLQLLLSTDKTLSFRYQSYDLNDVVRGDTIADGTNIRFVDSPLSLQVGSVAYQDLTSRPWADSFAATAYWNRQEDGRDEIRTRTPTINTILNDVDTVTGGSLEFGKFIGTHHLVYGVDYSRDKLSSKRRDNRVSDGTPAPTSGFVRGRYTDGAKYETMGIYLNDRFDITRWVTATAGLRYGTFSSSGSEPTSVGTITIDGENSDFTGAINVVVHATSNLNLIGSVIRGFRAPNLDDISKFSERREGIEVPNPDVEAERVNSYELGLKYESTRFSATAFYYHNAFTNLLDRALGSFNGMTFFDANGNGVEDKGELPFFQTQNIGEAEIEGYELAASYSPVASLFFRAHYNHTVGEDTATGKPLQRIPPATGSAAAQWRSAGARRPWAELSYQFASAQTRLSAADIADVRIGPNGTPAYDVLHLRGGFDLSKRFRITGGIENITDEAYKYHGSFAYRPGRQLVLTTQLEF